MHLPGVRPDPGFRRDECRFVYEGRMVRVSRDRIHLPHGHETVYETIHLPSAVSVVPVLEVREKGPEVILVEQFRSAVGGHIHEIPAGIVEDGEEPGECARRELEEETGYSASSWTHLASLFMIPGTSAHRMHFFLAEGLSPGRQALDQGECLRVCRYPAADLLRCIVYGDREPLLVDTKTHVGLLHAAWLRGWDFQRKGS